MKKIILSLIVYCILFSCVVHSQDVISKGGEVRWSFDNFVCGVFCIIWFVIAAVAALMIVYSGIKYLTSESGLERDKIKTRLKYAVAGLIIVIIAVPAANYLTSDMIAPFNCDCVSRAIPTTTTSTTSTTTIHIITTTTTTSTTSIPFGGGVVFDSSWFRFITAVDSPGPMDCDNSRYAVNIAGWLDDGSKTILLYGSGEDPIPKFDDLKNILIDAGYNVDTMERSGSDITEDLLMNYGQVWFLDRAYTIITPLTPSEIAAVTNYHGNEGNILLSGEDCGYPCYADMVNAISREAFDVTMGSSLDTSSLIDADWCVTPSFIHHPLGNGVSKLSSSTTDILLTSNNPNVEAIATLGGTDYIMVLDKVTASTTTTSTTSTTTTTLLETHVLIAALKQNMKSVYSDSQITTLENKIEDYRSALGRDGLGSIYLYLDEDETSDLIGTKVSNTGDWNEVDGVLDQLIPKLNIRYVLIIGGYDMFPSARVGAYYTDNHYSDYTKDSIPDVALGRLPDPRNGDLDLFINSLDSFIDSHDSGGLDLSSHVGRTLAYGYASMECWSEYVWGQRCQPYIKCRSGTGDSKTAASGKGFFYLTQHGSRGPPQGYADALTPNSLNGMDLSNTVWMIVPCYGGVIDYASTSQGIVLTFFRRGGAVHMGSTNTNCCANQAGICTTSIDHGGVAALYYRVAKNFVAGTRVGDAYKKGKTEYKNDIGSGPSYEFYINCLYGDPTLKIKTIW
ncbi:MAG: pilin [Candidatus Altiarchaeota archaeon]|nr:pilin [Candidatus Altiarchaeota archaeon]